MHVFYNAGLDIGNVSPKYISAKNNPIGGGMELRSFSKINTQIMADINTYSLEEVAQRNYKDMQTPWPMYLKDPRYILTWPVWEQKKMRPMHVFLCMRNPEAIDKSIKETTDWNMQNPYLLYQKMFGCLTYLLENDISYTLVHYPRLAKDRVYTERILSAYMENPWEVVQKTWDESLHHFKSTT